MRIISLKLMVLIQNVPNYNRSAVYDLKTRKLYSTGHISTSICKWMREHQTIVKEEEIHNVYLGNAGRDYFEDHDSFPDSLNDLEKVLKRSFVSEWETIKEINEIKKEREEAYERAELDRLLNKYYGISTNELKP
jgi:hypothetical protein